LKNKDISVEFADQELVARMNLSDERAFEALYENHREWVLRMAWRITDSQQLAEDVSQEVFRYFLNKFPGFELRCQLRTFLYPVVRNLSLTSLKGQKRFVGGETGAAFIDQLATTAGQGSEHHDFHQIISGLSPDHREILMLRFVDGMTLPEIAVLTDIPLGTAKSRLHHALAALRSDPQLKNLANTLNESTVENT
jgi:RNA polymerase sigma-70 factor (ECF subfamily)